MLELDQVRKHYRSPAEVIRAVDGISLSLSPGELVAIRGPSGSGKTTLLLLAAAILRPDAGAVRFRGKDLDALSEREAADYRRNELGFVFQSFNLVPGMTALDNVALALMLGGQSLRRARPEAMRMLELVGLRERATHVPGKLSGGERQRVAIARALAGDPALILADEPTGNLDTERGNQILGLLSELARERGVAVILVTHDARAANYADRIQELRDGRTVEDQAAHEAIADRARPVT